MTPLLTIELPGLPPLLLNSRMHWRKLHQQRSEWKFWVRIAVKGHDRRAGKITAPLDRARLVCTRYSATECDYDNLASSFKWILDGLKESGVIVDDKRSVIGVPDYRWEKARPKQGKIRVEIYATEEA